MPIDVDNIGAKLQLTKDSLLNIFNNSIKNPFNKKPNRKLSLNIQDTVKYKSPPEYNAYALYEDDEDMIFITKGLLELIINLFDGYTAKQERDSWMIQIASEFFLYHEFGHLYSGHCQLKKKQLLPMIRSANVGITSFDWQALEIEADAFSAARCVERISGFDKSSDKTKTVWDDNNSFVIDSNVAIEGAFFIMRLLEVCAGDKTYYMGDHPPSLTRFIRVVANMENYAKTIPNIGKNEYNFDISHVVENAMNFANRLSVLYLSDYKLLADKPNYTSVENYLDSNIKTLESKLEKLRRIPFPTMSE